MFVLCVYIYMYIYIYIYTHTHTHTHTIKTLFLISAKSILCYVCFMNFKVSRHIDEKVV